MNPSATLPGFQQLTLDAQETFRSLLNAWSHPGKRCATDRLTDTPKGLHIASGCLALTLLDQDTVVWLSPELADATGWLRFHCSCPMTNDKSAADFAFANSGELLDFSDFKVGTALSPEQGATIILQVDDLETGALVTLNGPGLQQATKFPSGNLSAALWESRTQINQLYPTGIDLVLTDANHFTVLPRTTHVTQEH